MRAVSTQKSLLPLPEPPAPAGGSLTAQHRWSWMHRVMPLAGLRVSAQSTSVASAKVVFRTHEPLLRELCAPNLVSQIQRQLNEVRARRAIAQQMPVSPMRVADGAPALVGADHFVQSCEARGPQLYVRRLRPMA